MLRLLFITFISFIFSVNSVFAAEILVIQSYHKEYAWDKDYTKALKERVGKEHNLTFVRMDTKRIPKSQFQKSADLAWKKYLEAKPDYVVLGDDNALKYLGKRFGETDTPVVFLGINNKPEAYFKGGKIPANITGVLEKPLLIRNVFYLKKLLPKVKKVLFLFDSGPTAKAAFSTNTTKSQKVTSIKYDVAYIAKKSDWEKSVKEARKNGYDAIFVGLYHTITDESGKHVPASNILKWTNENADLPLFAFWTFAVGSKKTAGGIVLDGYEQGIAAAKLLDRVMQGEKPEIMIGEKGKLLFSKSELNRWNLKLPENIKKLADIVD